jgi:hypothetical protein
MSFSFPQLETKDWLVILATIAGPILAVQAQKWVERLRERHNRKLRVFERLMATRAARLSAEHVQALNMIDLVFYGSYFFGIHRRSKTEQVVIDAWREYLDQLSTRAADAAAVSVWNARNDELFINLLFAIAKDVHYKFDRVQLKKGAYSPQAHGDLELEQNMIRKLVLKLLSGENALKMDVASFPADENALKTQLAANKALSDALTGKGTLNVTINHGDSAA